MVKPPMTEALCSANLNALNTQDNSKMDWWKYNDQLNMKSALFAKRHCTVVVIILSKIGAFLFKYGDVF